MHKRVISCRKPLYLKLFIFLSDLYDANAHLAYNYLLYKIFQEL